MQLYQRLSQARKAKNLSISALADRVGVSSTAAWNWEYGYTTPRQFNVEKIAEVLDVDSEYLLYGRKAPLAVGNAEDSVSGVLARAKAQLAKILDIPEGRIQIDIKVSA
jgi:transcriptional regulator with XRE-family HTH domain